MTAGRHQVDGGRSTSVVSNGGEGPSDRASTRRPHLRAARDQRNRRSLPALGAGAGTDAGRARRAARFSGSTRRASARTPAQRRRQRLAAFGAELGIPRECPIGGAAEYLHQFKFRIDEPVLANARTFEEPVLDRLVHAPRGRRQNLDHECGRAAHVYLRDDVLLVGCDEEPIRDGMRRAYRRDSVDDSAGGGGLRRDLRTKWPDSEAEDAARPVRRLPTGIAFSGCTE